MYSGSYHNVLGRFAREEEAAVGKKNVGLASDRTEGLEESSTVSSVRDAQRKRVGKAVKGDQ